MTIGYIYRIFCLDTSIKDEYIGSTTNIRQRKCAHKNAHKNEKHKSYNKKVYQYIRANGGWDNWRMDLVEEIEFGTRQELNRREGEVIQSRGATLNRQVAGRTVQESNKGYYDSHRDAILAHQRQLYNDNKEAFDEKSRVYYNSHKESISAQKKEYYLRSRKEINSEKFICLCGGVYIYGNRLRHYGSAKHIKNFEQGLCDYIHS